MRNYFSSFSQAVICLLFLALFSEFKCTAPITNEMIKRAKAGNKVAEEGNRFEWNFLAKKLEDLKNQLPEVDINQKNHANENHTALHYAVILGGSTDITKALLVRGARVDVQNDLGYTPLYWAAVYDRKEIAKILIKAGADVGTQDNGGITPLHQAVGFDKSMAELLLDNGADKEAKDRDGRRPLHIAAQWGYQEVVKLLLNNGANIEAKDNEDKSPLYLAAWSNKKEIVELLLKKRANVHIKEKRYGWTPLHIAARWGHIEIVRLLVEAGANVNAKDNKGLTPLDVISELNGNGRNNKEVIDYLTDLTGNR